MGVAVSFSAGGTILGGKLSPTDHTATGVLVHQVLVVTIHEYIIVLDSVDLTSIPIKAQALHNVSVPRMVEPEADDLRQPRVSARRYHRPDPGLCPSKPRC